MEEETVSSWTKTEIAAQKKQHFILTLKTDHNATLKTDHNTNYDIIMIKSLGS